MTSAIESWTTKKDPNTLLFALKQQLHAPIAHMVAPGEVEELAYLLISSLVYTTLFADSFPFTNQEWPSL